jgi:hypothetical protein
MFNNHRNFVLAVHDGSGNMMNKGDLQDLCKVKAANQATAARAVVTRGPQLMVVFAGRPLASDVAALLSANVKVGLALSPSELARAADLDQYSYLFVGNARKGRSPLKQAVADLAHNGWSIDDQGDLDADRAEPRAPRTPVRAGRLAVVQA